MKTRIIGIYEYIERFSDVKQDKLPLSMQLPTASSEAILLRLMLGQIHLKKNTFHVVKPLTNYMLLPYYKTKSLSYRDLNNVFSNSDSAIDVIDKKEIMNRYFTLNRKNHYIHEKALYEISSFYISQTQSPIAAFAHLYRCLEFIAYSFPMIYAAKSRDYTGSFADLKKFLSGNATGELGFFKKFLDALFNDETTTLDYKFEMSIEMSTPLYLLENDCRSIYKDLPYEIESGIMHVKFKDMLTFFITTRNHFFHMLVGNGQVNFSSIEYDINEYFESINPHILNWLSIIIQKIMVFGFYSSLSGI